MKKKMPRILLFSGIVLAVIILGLFAAIKYSSPVSPAPDGKIAAVFRAADYSHLPSLSYYQARDGVKLAYRSYPSGASSSKTVVLIHGSTGSSMMMHPLAKYLQGQGIHVYAPDMRGHGSSGEKGDIAYIGQLEDDLEDFIHEVVKERQDLTLVGFSSGGGFALRFAAGDRQNYFDRYILLAPFIGYNAPTNRPDISAWANASIARIICLSLLGPVGEKCLGHLPVLAFAADPENARNQTAVYSYRLLKNFGAHQNYKADLKNAAKPIAVMVGQEDEFFYPQKFLPVFAAGQPHAEITIVPDVGHVSLIIDGSALEAIAQQIVR